VTKVSFVGECDYLELGDSSQWRERYWDECRDREFRCRRDGAAGRSESLPSKPAVGIKGTRKYRK